MVTRPRPEHRLHLAPRHVVVRRGAGRRGGRRAGAGDREDRDHGRRLHQRHHGARRRQPGAGPRGLWSPRRSSGRWSSSASTSPAWWWPGCSSSLLRSCWTWVTARSSGCSGSGAPAAARRRASGAAPGSGRCGGCGTPALVERQRRRVVGLAPAARPWSRPARRPSPAAPPSPRSPSPLRRCAGRDLDARGGRASRRRRRDAASPTVAELGHDRPAAVLGDARACGPAVAGLVPSADTAYARSAWRREASGSAASPLPGAQPRPRQAPSSTSEPATDHAAIGRGPARVPRPHGRAGLRERPPGVTDREHRVGPPRRRPSAPGRGAAPTRRAARSSRSGHSASACSSALRGADPVPHRGARRHRLAGHDVGEPDLAPGRPARGRSRSDAVAPRRADAEDVGHRRTARGAGLAAAARGVRRPAGRRRGGPSRWASRGGGTSGY